MTQTLTTPTGLDKMLERILQERDAKANAQEARRIATLENELDQMILERQQFDSAYYATHFA